MNSLKKLILKYGEPDALIDHWDDTSKNMAIWGYDEIFYYDENGFYLNEKEIDGNPLELCDKILNKWNDDSPLAHAVGYISYDMKNNLYPHLNFKKNNNQKLIWFGKPKLIKEYLLLEDDELNNEENFDKKYYKNLFKINMGIPNIEEYVAKINKIKYYLKLGDTYQINYSNPIKCNYSCSKFSLYLYLRSIAKPANGFYLNTGENQILSLSPEKFFETKNDKIYTYPIKGTINRSDDIVEDNKLKKQLRKSEKDKAEHLMIVDLLRNDLGKICQYGTVQVENLYNIKSFETIHHMETTVYGNLLENINFKDIIIALFPGGSITGAPKERSMEIIDEIETYNREIYTGAIGYISSKRYMNFNIAIRTLNFKNNQGLYPVGGGIVWDSTAKGERKEALNKAKIIEKIVSNKLEEYA